MASLQTSVLPSATLHHEAFAKLNFHLKQASGDEFVLTITRHSGRHVVTDKLQLTVMRNGSCVYIISSCEATQCCSEAPQGDPRYDLFQNGLWLVKDGRCIVSEAVHCSRGQDNESRTADASVNERPFTEPKEVSTMVTKLFSGLAKMLKKGAPSSAIKTAWKPESGKSLLDSWYESASEGADALSLWAVTQKRTEKLRAEADYLHWLSQLMIGCLVYIQTKGKGKRNEPKDSELNCFIKWTKKIPKILGLLSVAGVAGPLILTALGNSLFQFSDLQRMARAKVAELRQPLWEILRPRLSHLAKQLRHTKALDQKVLIFNPIAFVCEYRKRQRQEPYTTESVCKQLRADDWAKAGSEVFAEKTFGELLDTLECLQPTSAEKRQDEQAGQWLNQWLQEISTTEHENETQPAGGLNRCDNGGEDDTSNGEEHNDSDDANKIQAEESSVAVRDDWLHESTSLPFSDSGAGVGSRGSYMRSGETGQRVVGQPLHGLDALADAASWRHILHSQADSGYGGSVMCPQATLSMPQPFHGQTPRILRSPCAGDTQAACHPGSMLHQSMDNDAFGMTSPGASSGQSASPNAGDSSFARGQKRSVGSLENGEVRSPKRHHPGPDGTVPNRIVNPPTFNLETAQSSGRPCNFGISLHNGAQQAEPELFDFTPNPADKQNTQSYDVPWYPLDWADGSGQQAEIDLFNFSLYSPGLGSEMQNIQSYDVPWDSRSSGGGGGQQAESAVFESALNLTETCAGENAQSYDIPWNPMNALNDHRQ